MKIIYASRHGHVETLVKNITDTALKIETGEEACQEDYILFTYTDGKGIVPAVVEKFLNNNAEHLKAVVASGNSERHKNEFCFAGDKVSEKYQVPCLAKVEGEGTVADIEQIKAEIEKLS